jgi:hypothetical protein
MRPNPRYTPAMIAREQGHGELRRGRCCHCASPRSLTYMLNLCGLQWAVSRSGSPALSEKDAKLALKMGHLHPFIAVFPPECMGQLASFGPA